MVFVLHRSWQRYFVVNDSSWLLNELSLSGLNIVLIEWESYSIDKK